MSYLAFIVPAYLIACGAPLWLAGSAWRRLRVARRNLAALNLAALDPASSGETSPQ